MTKKRVIITGASGFIGGHLIEYLKSIKEIEIVPLSRSYVANLIKVNNYADAPQGDVLIHLAEDNSLKSVANSSLRYECEVMSNLSALLTKDYKRIIYVSSSALYGDKYMRPCRTNDVIFVQNRYTQIKHASEGIVLANPAGVVVRLANVYGPRMSSNSVISEILEQIHHHGDLEVREVESIRDFIWVEDVVEGICMLALHNLVERTKSRIFNLGTGRGTSIGDLAKMTLDLAGQTERCVVSKNKLPDVSSIILDYSDTTDACGWIPKVILKEGISRLLNSNLGAC